MAHEQFKSCIDACNDCAEACDYCEASCLKEREVAKLAHCIQLDIDCAELCRLAVSYMLQGEVTYHQEGRPESVVRAGDGIAEGKDTTHWAENRGAVAAVWIAVDIPKNP